MNQNLNVKMKMLMIEKRLSNKELGEMVGISASAISLIMNGHQEPKLRTAQRIARALGTTVDELWPLDEDER